VLFNSFEFLVFFPIVFCLYWFVFNKSLKWQNALLLVASYFFYGWWSYKFLGLLMLSTLLDYIYGFSVASPNPKKAKLFLWLSIINNLGILGIFKYYNFFAKQFQMAFEAIGWHTDPVLLNIALPVGISFYTFHGMSYVFDIYRGKQKPVSNFIDYAVFVSFFPLLVAGPIERASHLLPQVQRRREFSYSQAVEGCRLMLWGMFKKVVIADYLSKIVDLIFTNYQFEKPSTLIMGAIAFSFQIYGDFSGYSDIALGTAKLLGFELLSNFRFPYFSRDIAEFWRRWHISLSSWFRDYLYIPLGGSKNGKLKAVRNTFIIFLVSGFWHGASWNFIVWGGIHACAFMPLLLMGKNRNNVTDVVAQNRKFPSLKELWQMFSTFCIVTFAWVFFRAPDIHSAFGYIKLIITELLSHPKYALQAPEKGGTAIIGILIILCFDWMFRKNERTLNLPENKLMRTLIYLSLGILVFLLFGQQKSFIYFQF
jgi:D-alanyl-lipoteichoic acid acyltransferase DltB (MBOAT superfamily)